MKVLVTGGAGFIGSGFVRFLLERRPDAEVVTLDKLTYAGRLENLEPLGDEPRHRFVRGDVTDARVVGELASACDAVVHLAAESHVDRSLRDARPFVRTNVVGTGTVLEAVRALGGRRLLHVSTDEVYGSLPLEGDAPGGGGAPFDEDSPLRPTSPYATSKAAGDELVRAWCAAYGLDAVVARPSNTLGPRQYPEKAVPLFATNAIEGGTLPLYGDGLHVRDWLHVEDLCEALLALLERGRAGEAYNIGAGNPRSNLELARGILRALGRGEESIERVPDRPGHDRRYAMDMSKIEKELNWQPARSAWPDALERTVRWYVEHPEWWRPLREGAGPSA